MRRWRALFVTLSLALLASPAAWAEPTHAELVERSMTAFADALKRDDWSALHASAAPRFREAQSPASLRKEFAALAALKLDLSVLNALEPVFTQELRQGNQLQLAGYYRSAPLRAYFEFNYESSGPDWQLIGVGVRVTPVIQTRTIRHNSGWTIVLDSLDPAREIFYALPGEAFRSTGHTAQRDPSTGDALPRTTIDVPTLPPSLQVKVTTRAGTIGPLTLTFDENAALVRQAIDTLEQTRSAWAHLRTFDERELLYFTHLVTSRCGIETVRYSLDSDRLDREYALPPCNPADPYSVPEDFEIVTLERKPAFVTVQLDYRDGQRSAPVRIPHPEADAPKPPPRDVFLAQRRAEKPWIHSLLRDLAPRMGKATLEQLHLRDGAVTLRAHADDGPQLLASLQRAISLTDVALEATPDTVADQTVLQIRAKARPMVSVEPAELRFLVFPDFDTAAAALADGLRATLADARGCEEDSMTPFRSSHAEAHRRVTLKVRVRCETLHTISQLFLALEPAHAGWFVDDLQLRVLPHTTRIEVKFDLYGYHRAGILR